MHPNANSPDHITKLTRRHWLGMSTGIVTANFLSAWSPNGSALAQTTGKSASGRSRLWDKEPALWDIAKKYQITRQLSAQFGWEGPRGGRGAIPGPGPGFTGPGKNGVNISNERLESSLWGTPNRLVLSLGKTDVWNRARMNHEQGKKPVGQIQILAEDFIGADLPQVTTTIHNGNHELKLTKVGTEALIQLLLTDSDTNVIAIRAVYTGMSKPISVRLYRHQDTGKVIPDPTSGADDGYFWIHQTFAAEKTFPEGFEYFLVGKIAGSSGKAELAQLQVGLGAPVPTRKDDVPGSAATVTLPQSTKKNLIAYFTVVTRAESDNPLAEAKRRLTAAEKQGYAALLAKNEKKHQALYSRRERGRIFTGNFDDAKDVIMPFFYQGSWQFRHTYNSHPDPEKFEGDANYSILETDKVLWCGLPCFNEELYTPDFVAFRDESVAPYYVKLFNFWRKACEDVAKARGFQGMLLLRGYVPPLKPDKYWSPDGPANNPNATDWASMVFAFKNVWDAWDYGDQDIEFLKDKVYPCLRGIADFFAGKSVLGEDGFYHIDPSQIREETQGKDAIDCIGAAKWSFRMASQASVLLKVDEDKRKLWQERLSKMAPYYVIQNGKGESVFASIVADGKPVTAGNGTTHFIVNVADEINLESTDEQKQIAVRSNNHKHEQPMNRQVEHLLGHQPDTLFMGPGGYPWICAFGHSPWIIYYAQKLGAGDFSRNIELKTPQQKTIACWLEPERLCNSRSGTIFFFPAVPSGIDIAFKDFQARGSFLVSGEYRGGKVTHAAIKARRNGKCSVMNPWPGNATQVRQTPGNTNVKVSKEGDKIVFDAQAGKNYAIMP